MLQIPVANFHNLLAAYVKISLKKRLSHFSIFILRIHCFSVKINNPIFKLIEAALNAASNILLLKNQAIKLKSPVRMALLDESLSSIIKSSEVKVSLPLFTITKCSTPAAANPVPVSVTSYT